MPSTERSARVFGGAYYHKLSMGSHESQPIPVYVLQVVANIIIGWREYEVLTTVCNTIALTNIYAEHITQLSWLDGWTANSQQNILLTKFRPTIFSAIQYYWMHSLKYDTYSHQIIISGFIQKGVWFSCCLPSVILIAFSRKRTASNSQCCLW